VRLRPVDDVGDDQEVAGEAPLQDRLDLEVEAGDVARRLTLTSRGIGKPQQPGFATPLVEGVLETKADNLRGGASDGLATRLETR
jgi:hypothetical protein